MRESNGCVMELISKSIQEAGYDPYTQLYGFLMTGNECFVTRSGKARERLKGVDRMELETYVRQIRSA